jgi:hypothetical protein
LEENNCADIQLKVEKKNIEINQYDVGVRYAGVVWIG